MPSERAPATVVATSSFDGVRNAQVNGIALAYREEGKGDAVVFVHGSASDLRCWAQQLPAIGTSYRAIAYSRRYARPNQDIEPGVDDQMLPHTEDLVGLLRVLDAAPAHLVGHSWGAFVALLTAIRYPELVRSMVLAEPPVLSLFMSTPPRPSEVLRLFARHPRTAIVILGFSFNAALPAIRAFRRGDNERAMRAFGSGFFGREGYERIPEARKQQLRDNLSTLRAQLLGAGFPPLSEGEVRRVATPTLLVTGERSPAFPLRLTDRLEQLLPNAERVEIAGASHGMTEQNPKAFNEAIHRFLARHSSHEVG